MNEQADINYQMSETRKLMHLMELRAVARVTAKIAFLCGVIVTMTFFSWGFMPLKAAVVYTTASLTGVGIVIVLFRKVLEC